MEALLAIIAIVIGLFIGIRWTIGYVRSVTAKTGHGFLSLPFWILALSLLIAVYVGFTAEDENWIAVIVFGAIAIAGLLNIKSAGVQHGFVFTVLQCIAVYCSVIVLILFVIFKGAKDSGPKFG